MAERPVIIFNYLNHRGVLAERKLMVDGIEFHHRPGYGYQPGWFISGTCMDKNARRSFALSRIELPNTPGSVVGNIVFSLLKL